MRGGGSVNIVSVMIFTPFALFAALSVPTPLYSTGISFTNEGAYIYEDAGRPCRCTESDLSSWNYSHPHVTSIQIGGCSDGWCSRSHSFSGSDTGSIQIPFGKCIEKVNLSFTGVPGAQSCTSSSQCPQGTYSSTGVTYTPVFYDCVGSPGQGG